MNEAYVQLAIGLAPSVVELFRAAFVHAHPDAPVPTGPEIMAAYHEAFQSSLAKDDAILAAHPEQES